MAIQQNILATAFCVALFFSWSAFPQQSTKPCAEPEQKQFDFWVGEWELTTPGESGGGTNRVRQAFEGCVIEENFSGGPDNPLVGMSVSRFDPIAKKWKQTWVDNQGAYLDFSGEFQDGQMILQREASDAAGARFLQRMVWKNIGADELDWSWESSKDQGKTWKVIWPVHYKRRKS
ncbi:MAG: DUF1579 family protein [Acidobacteria bacterium]|nr:DUF1579 family protein [Acidobacteriota bacterium]